MYNVYNSFSGDSDEISFTVDDIITNIEMIDDGWANGTIAGARGMFPISYIEFIETASPTKPTRRSTGGASRPPPPQSAPPPAPVQVM